MRKGRSQRKTRGSLPPLSGRSHASGAGADAAPPASRGPQVVIGLTSHRGDEPEARESRSADVASPTTPSRAMDRLEIERLATGRLEVLGEPTLELVHDADHEGDALEPVDSLAPVERELVSDPFALALTEETPLPVAHVTSLVTPDELSIPPMGDLSVEPIAERFFSEGELVAAHADEDESWDREPDKAQRKTLPHVVERRQRFARYVRWAVAGAAVVCLAAVARTTLTPHRAPAAAVAAIPVEVVAPKAAAAPVVAPESVNAPKVDVPKAEAPKVDAPKVEDPKVAAAEPPKVEEPKVEEPKAVAVAAPGDKTAAQEKVDSRRNLERGKLAEAIEAGERSVALDPQDGEAWLLLGAAYQEKGKNAEARRAYKACLTEGKRGPIGECRAMLR
ncbi:hypothetical protein BH11MYX4_BH11MYX4_34230 [soil metagenome]